MHGAKEQLDRLHAVLTAKERALAALKASKRDERPDDAIFSTMPPEQAPDYLRYVNVVLATNDLGPDIMLLEQSVVEVELLDEQFHLARLRALEVAALGAYIREHMREPITASAYADRQRTLRMELVPAVEFAELLAERRADAQTREGVTLDEDRPRAPRAKRWSRLVSDGRRELEELVAAGTLRGVKKGRRVVIEAGSFYDWFGEEMPVFSDECTDYDVYSDTDAATVAWRQESLRGVRQILANVPRPSIVPLDLDPASPDDPGADAEADWERTVAISVRDGVQARWSKLRAIEIIVDEIANAHFDGEDPLRPAPRSALGDCRRRLSELHLCAQSVLGDFELPEPCSEDIDRLRRVVQGRARRRRRSRA